MRIRIIFSVILISLLTACHHKEAQQQTCIDATNYQQLACLRAPEKDQNDCASHSCQHGRSSGGCSQIRQKALDDTALSLAAQGGLAWASKNINQRLECDKWSLETIYNFNAMMLSHGVLPPVLEEGDTSLNLADPDTIRVADKTYKIVKQARFVTTPPNWREYLWMTFSKPEVPSTLLLPRNAAEIKIWCKSIQTGWEKGMQQAYSIYQQNLARLKRDYNGMILYRKLLQKRMISQPYVSRTELGVTGDCNNMRINDQVLRITEHPCLQTDSKCWEAIIVRPDENA